MTMTSSNWLSAMAVRFNELDQGVPITFNWKQSLLTIQLRVVGFAYHRDQFLDLQARAGELDLKMFEITFPDERTAEALSLDSALAGAQLWAASQALHSACDMMLRVFNYTHARQRPGSVPTMATSTVHRSHLAMKKLRNSDAFQYLDGFVTLSNRSQLLRVCQRRMDHGQRVQQQLMIDSFVHEFDSTVLSFAAKWVDDFLCRDCETLIELCSQLGQALASEISST